MNIREQIEVLVSDRRHVGTADKLEGERIKLTKKDSGDGHRHYVDKSWSRAWRVMLARKAASLAKASQADKRAGEPKR